MTYRQAMHLRRLIRRYVLATQNPVKLMEFGDALRVLNAYINRHTTPRQSSRTDQRRALGGF